PAGMKATASFPFPLPEGPLVAVTDSNESVTRSITYSAAYAAPPWISVAGTGATGYRRPADAVDVSVGGRPATLTTGTARLANAVYSLDWRDGERLVTVTSVGLSRARALAAAASVRPVDAEDWHSAIVGTRSMFGPEADLQELRGLPGQPDIGTTITTYEDGG